MSIDHPKIVDAIGTERATGDVDLTIADQRDWSDVVAHLRALQEKINSYLDFLESGDVFREYPAAKEKKMKILIIFRYPPPAGDAFVFLARAEEFVRERGFGLAYRVSETPA
ncbi:MAG: hypothetical protein IPL39_12605 [Opitutaceae bacterium]|nr:hypothetical protein [Opitutaceae bacterium]